MRLLIVGGVAGGASAAARARRLSEEAEILLFERGPDVSFANCGLPYYIGDEIKERGKLLVVGPDLLRQRFRLDVRTRTQVEAIDRARQVVRVRDLAAGRAYEEAYDKLILAPGAAPIRPPLPGVELPGIHTLRTLADSDRIRAAIDGGARRVVLLGGGFIGLELAENLARRGVAVTLVEKADQLLAPFDREMTTPVLQELRKQGVEVLLGESAVSFAPGLRVTLSSGRELEAGLVVVGVGVRPENTLARDAGLTVGPRGGIVVNEYLQTSDPDIYAVGDAIETRDVVTGQGVQVPLGGPANRQGRLAADHIFGNATPYRGTQGTAIVRVFGKTAALTGASERTLRQAGRPYRALYLHPSHHAGYYPGAEMMTLKVLFDPTDGTLLGAQAVGGAGVDKRIDVLSMAIQGKMSVFDLEEAELAYAPQFGSAKDPINMAGFIGGGILRGEHPQVTVGELATLERPFVLDVRTPQEFAAGHLPGAVSIPVDELRTRLAEVPRDRRVIAYCRVGQRGYLASRVLLQAGYDVANLSGGYLAWELFQ